MERNVFGLSTVDNTYLYFNIYQSVYRNGVLFKKYHLQHGLGEVEIGKTIVTDTTVFDKVNYEGLYEAADMFIKREHIGGG